MEIVAEAAQFGRTGGLNFGIPRVDLVPARRRAKDQEWLANSLLLRHSPVRSMRSASSNSERRRNRSQHRFCGPGSTRRTGGGAFVLRQFSTNRLTVRLVPRYPS